MNSHRFRLLAPAGAPIRVRAILESALPLSRDREYLTEILKGRLGVKYCFLLSSGRAALTVLLQALQQLSDRREVVIPAYTCFSVPSAVVRAGLSIRVCDVDPKTLDLDYSAFVRLDLDRVLCIVPAGLFGIPADLVALEKIVRNTCTFLVDDAAQCLGASVLDRPCGTFGDAGLFSLARGKNITAMGGGILVTRRKDLAHLIDQKVVRLPRASAIDGLSIALCSLVYAALLPPYRYWIPNRIPFLRLGLSVFDPNFEMAQLSSYQQRLAARLITLLDHYNQIRKKHAHYLRDGIREVEGIEIPQPGNGVGPVYLRFPILARDEKHRTRVINRLRAAGIGASASYPTPISDIPGIRRYLVGDQQDCPGARTIANRIITLPTHPYVTAADVENMVEIVRSQK